MTSGFTLAGWATTRMFRADPPTLGAVARTGARLAAPVATNRRIGIVSLDGGTGTSTVAAAVASALARSRPAAVLAVDAHRSARGLAWHLGVDAPPRGRPERPPASVAQARAATAASPAGPLVVAAADAAGETVDIASWGDAVGPLSRFFDVTVTDFGRRGSPGQLHEIVDRCHAVCLVAHADRHSAELAVLSAGTAPVVLCLVDRQGIGRPVAPVLRTRGIPVGTVPRDRALESGPFVDGIGLSATLALDVLAGEVLTAARGTLDRSEAPL